MTQHDLARAIGVPQPSIARIERGAVMPRTATLVTILDATGHRLAADPVGPPVDRQAVRRQLARPVSMRTRLALGKRATDPVTNPGRILRRLRRLGVPFVLIGDLAEAAHGAPAKVGRHIEVCVSTADVARERLGRALAELEAESHQARLRVTTTTAAGDGYDALAANAVSLHVEPGILVKVAAVEDLLRIRRAGSDAQDREAASVLAAIIEESADTER